jgi:hypothetical protein
MVIGTNRTMEQMSNSTASRPSFFDINSLSPNLEVFSTESIWALVLSKSIALHFVRCCHLCQAQATKIVNLDHAYRILTYLYAIIRSLSEWLREEGIGIESSQKIVGGFADVDYKLHDRATTLEDTYSKENIRPNDTKGCSKFLKLNSAAHTKPI